MKITSKTGLTLSGRASKSMGQLVLSRPSKKPSTARVAGINASTTAVDMANQRCCQPNRERRQHRAGQHRHPDQGRVDKQAENDAGRRAPEEDRSPHRIADQGLI